MPLNIKNKRSAVQGSAPSSAQLEDGEIGVNYNALDPAIYLKDSAGAVVRIAGSGAIGGPTVFSVNGEVGNVVLDANDVGAATTAQGAVADSATQPGDNVSTLLNDAGYITSGDVPAAPVDSVNGQTGTVVLAASDVGAATTAQGITADSALQPGDNVSQLANDAGYITSAPPAPVDSVNGQTGVVVLNAADVGAATTAQGNTADSAVQPGDLATVATSGDYDDLTNKPAPGLTDTSTAATSLGVGTNALSSETTGFDNTAVGSGAGRLLADGRGNSAFGENALQNLVGGDFNTIVGHDSGTAISSGFRNTSLGYFSLRGCTTGAGNVAVGNDALQNASGSNNVAVGNQAGDQIATGSGNTCIGYEAQPSSGTVSNEITLGHTTVTKFRVPGINFILKDNGGTPTEGQVLTADSSGEGYWAEPVVNSGPTAVPGANSITNMMSLTQAEYDAIPAPDASTLYVITP